MTTVQETLHEIDLSRPQSPLEPVFQVSRGVAKSSRVRGLELRAEWLLLSEDQRPAAIEIVERLLKRSKK